MQSNSFNYTVRKYIEIIDFLRTYVFQYWQILLNNQSRHLRDILHMDIHRHKVLIPLSPVHIHHKAILRLVIQQVTQLDIQEACVENVLLRIHTLKFI